jgi:hypothetical protein
MANADDGAAAEQVSQSERRATARLPVAFLSIAIGLTVVVIAVVAVLAGRSSSTPGTGDGSASLTVGAVDQPGASGKYCTTVMSALPDDLSGLAKRTLADPTPGVQAWGDPAVVLRCGLPDPEELSCSSALDQIDNVAWLVLTDGGATTFIAVDRPVRVAVTFTDAEAASAHTGPIQQISDLLAADLPPRDVCTNGTLVPPDNA